MAAGCRNASEPGQDETYTTNGVPLTSSDGNPAYVRFSSFQNPDSTWGFTIFVDSRPFLLYKKIPVNRATKGFASKNDAESVARLFVMMVKAGDVNPTLTKKAIESLGISIGNKKRP